MKKIVLISASPKVNEPSISKKHLKMTMGKIDELTFEKVIMDVRQISTKHNEDEAYAQLSEADAIIFSFPLYYFCLPGILISFLASYYHFIKEKNRYKDRVKIYAIVNCGFPEPEINLEAIRVIESFSRHIGAEFRIGVMIGGGPMMLSSQAMNAPVIYHKYQEQLSAGYVR